MEIEGTVYAILPQVSGQSSRGSWVRQEMVIEFKSGEFNKKLSLSFWGDKTNQLANLKQGEMVKAFFDLESREFNGKWFTTAQTWKIERSIPQNEAMQGVPPIEEVPFSDDYNEPF
ncbi:MAG: DUF3127 domain-containing protein [Rikenellaceae bacterium]